MTDFNNEETHSDGHKKKGIALCLSGGGYRAMVFHLGAIIRLNEIGLLPHLSRISSVSGGSVTSAYLGVRWKDLQFDENGRAENLSIVIDKIREMARTNIDAGAIIGGILLPGTISDRVAKAYDKVLFEGRTTNDLPDDEHGPRFVINATNIQSAALWRFSRPFMGDYRVGLVNNPAIKLSIAVAASSAFPPVLSPSTLSIPRDAQWSEGTDLATAEYRSKVVLSDGGVYDNLGLETAKQYQTLLVSDAGQKILADESPHHDWARHSVRVLDVIDNQVRSLRKRILIDGYQHDKITGCYWSVRSSVEKYMPVSDPLRTASRDASSLAAIPTRLEAMPNELQEKLINWGYAITDIALRKYYKHTLEETLGIIISEPSRFPYNCEY